MLTNVTHLIHSFVSFLDISPACSPITRTCACTDGNTLLRTPPRGDYRKVFEFPQFYQTPHCVCSLPPLAYSPDYLQKWCQPDLIGSISPLFSFPFRYNELASPVSPSNAKLTTPQETLREKQINSPQKVTSVVEKTIVLPRPTGFWKEHYPPVVTVSPTLKSPVGFRLSQTVTNGEIKGSMCNSDIYNHSPVHPLHGVRAISAENSGGQEPSVDRENSPTGIMMPELMFKVSSNPKN